VGLTVLDAGVIVAALDAEDAHHAAAVEALRAGRLAGDELLLPASAYAECLVWPMRAGADAAAAAEAFIDLLPATVIAADRSVCRTAARLRARHGPSLRLPDALVIATAIETGAARVLTADRRWPSGVGAVVEVIGPEP
jgi:predicted nucleic acid-binding protein